MSEIRKDSLASCDNAHPDPPHINIEDSDSTDTGSRRVSDSRTSTDSSSRRVSEAGSGYDLDEADALGALDEAWTRSVDPVVVDNLAQGFLQKLQPDLTKSRSLLEELTENQRILIETIQQENGKFNDCQAYKEVSETMDKAKIYHAKLLNIKRDMIALHEKSAKLKKRALRIKQQKEKEMLEREQVHEAELERERMLVAKPAKKS